MMLMAVRVEKALGSIDVRLFPSKKLAANLVSGKLLP
jgi:hypothetical protein